MKHSAFNRLLFILSWLFFLPLVHASTQPKFIMVATTPTVITVPKNRHAYIQYRVINNTSLTRTLTYRPIPGATLVTESNLECTNPFVLAPGGSCLLTFYVEGSSLTGSYVGGPVVCKTAPGTQEPDQFLCSQPEPSETLSITSTSSITATDMLYVTNWDGNSISLCYINNGALTDCLISALSEFFSKPEALAMTDDYLFVANIGGGISSCLIDSESGELSRCIDAAPIEPIYAPTGIAIQGGTAYVANSGPETFFQGVTSCSVQGDSLSNCVFTQGDASFAVPSDLAITDNTLYVTNFESQSLLTTYCTIDSPLCTISSGEGSINGTQHLLNNPEGIYFNTLNGVTYAYFTNRGNNTVVLCEVSSPTTFSNCSVTSGYFYGFGNLAIFNNTAFLPSGKKTIATCSVDGSSGALSNCVNSGLLSFNTPSGLLVRTN